MQNESNTKRASVHWYNRYAVLPELLQGIPREAFETGAQVGLTIEDDTVTVDLPDILRNFVDRTTDKTHCFVIVEYVFGDSFRLSFTDLSNRFDASRDAEASAQN